MSWRFGFGARSGELSLPCSPNSQLISHPFLRHQGMSCGVAACELGVVNYDLCGIVLTRSFYKFISIAKLKFLDPARLDAFF